MEVEIMPEHTDDKIKLLIVDDEVEFLDALGQRLEMRDFDVHRATSGRQALEICRNDKFDLALIDLKMPGMDGRELLTELKQAHEHLEVIVLTGHGSVRSAVDCVKGGAFGYLPKPYKIDELLLVLRNAYAERLRNKFKADEDRTAELARLAMEESPLGILRKMRELDDGQK
jgi:DNA-binding NtrC family response regulator